MTFRTVRTIKKPRRAHRCVHCLSTIPAGVSHNLEAGVWDGAFYTARMHHDCAALWAEAYDTYADWDEGMVHDLLEAIEGDESRELRDEAYNHYRGRYPHVICRLELRWQRADIAAADRLRARGTEPDPEDYPEVYG